MVNNDVIRSLRYILNISDQKIVEMISSAGLKVTLEDVSDCLLDEEHENYLLCSDEVMVHFLDGLIYFRRGQDKDRERLPFEFPVSNNLVLKKLRVAFQLQEEEMHELLQRSDYTVGRSEMSAFLRKKGHPNYRECGDQVLRYFLKGLKLKLRG